MTEHDKNLQKIYQKKIMEWAQRPNHKKDIADLQDVATEKNPMCGDIISVGVHEEDNNLYWGGEGCMICCAAAEAFCEGHNKGDIASDHAQKIIEDYHHDGEVFPPFEAFQSIKDVPQRLKCVTLIAKAVQKRKI